MSVSFAQQIPVIDFQPFLQGNTAQQQTVVTEIYHACRDIGFVYLTGYGIDARLTQKLFAQTQQLFQLPLTVKQQFAWSDAHSNQGYVGIARERLDPSQPGDLKEAFNIGSADLPWLKQPSKGEQFQQVFAALSQSIADFYQACVFVLDGILRAIACALDLPEDFFTTRHNQQQHTLRLLHYPPLEQSPATGQIRAGAHSDYGSLTLLFQDAIGGLEVQTKTGSWVSATPIPNTVLVNLGDLMERWTNCRFRSTKHRVVIPTDDRSQKSRYSAAFFCHPNDDVEVACLESCQSLDRPPLYAPISAGDYLLSRLQATY